MEKIDELLSRTPIGPLYHYTNTYGFLGILADPSSIWASSAYHLNDAKDFRYAVTLIQDRLRERLIKERGPWNEFYGEVQRVMSSITQEFQAYVASFSEDGDLLSQWLTYSGSGNGYAVGFLASHLGAAKQNGFMLVPCIYNEKEKIELADAVINVLCEQLQSEQEGTGPNYFPFRKVLVAVAAIKHAGFEREAEWRLVKTLGVGSGSSRGVLFRSGRNGVVPYLEAPLRSDVGPLVPHAIHVGPRDDMEAATIAIKTFLDAKSLPDVSIVPSKTPFRP
jgi:hypothetical protein